MTSNPCFESVESWAAARAMLDFEPLAPKSKALRGARLRVHVRDHKLRELTIAARSLEAHCDGFVFSQARPGGEEARRLALEVPYGSAPEPAKIGGHPGRTYPLGPEPPPDDIDGRPPAVVVWHDAGLFYLLASDSKSVEDLLEVANSLYR